MAYSNEDQSLLRDLLDAGAILIGGIIKQRFGLNSPVYVDLRESIYARPELLWRVGGAFAKKIVELSRNNSVPQAVVGIPDTATPLALTTALYAWQNRLEPKITFALLRREAKKYLGLPETHWIGNSDRQWEYNLIDDVVASGLTKRAATLKLNNQGINVRRIVVLFDREQGDGLRSDGFELHSIFRLSEVVNYYASEGLIQTRERDEIIRFLQTHRFDAAPAAK